MHDQRRSRKYESHEVEPYIRHTEAAISVHNRSTSSFSRLRAKICRSGSGSDKKPTRPAAEVRPTIIEADFDTLFLNVMYWCRFWWRLITVQ